ncbi:hypothetical protein BIV57_06635 [Mangrovactinospora gilvigrisea]|uniref:Uncharacterized protein n=1 Tax=Mangrovactinospora gilvigrisea TaxID=1428644 RepID=A0A1J7CF51_9ACTN|nr:hypothetical protein [Mangrovactinospora gilvigrisea]OIV38330.1 hypothetical protein BIV57_06635 [Mangrovactinospora gilvigrisea]
MGTTTSTRGTPDTPDTRGTRGERSRATAEFRRAVAEARAAADPMARTHLLRGALRRLTGGPVTGSRRAALLDDVLPSLSLADPESVLVGLAACVDAVPVHVLDAALRAWLTDPAPDAERFAETWRELDRAGAGPALGGGRDFVAVLLNRGLTPSAEFHRLAQDQRAGRRPTWAAAVPEQRGAGAHAGAPAAESEPSTLAGQPWAPAAPLQVFATTTTTDDSPQPTGWAGTEAATLAGGWPAGGAWSATDEGLPQPAAYHHAAPPAGNALTPADMGDAPGGWSDGSGGLPQVDEWYAAAAAREAGGPADGESSLAGASASTSAAGQGAHHRGEDALATPQPSPAAAARTDGAHADGRSAGAASETAEPSRSQPVDDSTAAPFRSETGAAAVDSASSEAADRTQSTNPDDPSATTTPPDEGPTGGPQGRHADDPAPAPPTAEAGAATAAPDRPQDHTPDDPSATPPTATRSDGTTGGPQGRHTDDPASTPSPATAAPAGTAIPPAGRPQEEPPPGNLAPAPIPAEAGATVGAATAAPDRPQVPAPDDPSATPATADPGRGDAGGPQGRHADDQAPAPSPAVTAAPADTAIPAAGRPQEDPPLGNLAPALSPAQAGTTVGAATAGTDRPQVPAPDDPSATLTIAASGDGTAGGPQDPGPDDPSATPTTAAAGGGDAGGPQAQHADDPAPAPSPAATAAPASAASGTADLPHEDRSLDDQVPAPSPAATAPPAGAAAGAADLPHEDRSLGGPVPAPAGGDVDGVGAAGGLPPGGVPQERSAARDSASDAADPVVLAHLAAAEPAAALVRIEELRLIPGGGTPGGLGLGMWEALVAERGLDQGWQDAADALVRRDPELAVRYLTELSERWKNGYTPHRLMRTLLRAYREGHAPR